MLNHMKLCRLYADERLQVRRRAGRTRALGARAPLALPQGPNQRWSLSFLHDQLSDGRRFRILAVVDDFTRECLGLAADTSVSGVRAGRELRAIIARRGKPAMCVSDDGTEFTSMAMLRWSEESRVEWHYIAPGKRSKTPFGSVELVGYSAPAARPGAICGTVMRRKTTNVLAPSVRAASSSVLSASTRLAVVVRTT